MARHISWKEQIRALEESHLKPDVRSSAEAMYALLADEFVEFGSSGTVYADKRKMIESMSDAPTPPMSLSNFQAKLLAPDVVLTTYRVIRYDEIRTRTKHTLRSSVWKHMDGRWQIIFHQGTPTAAPDQ